MDGWMGGCLGRWMDGKTIEWMDGQTDNKSCVMIAFYGDKFKVLRTCQFFMFWSGLQKY